MFHCALKSILQILSRYLTVANPLGYLLLNNLPVVIILGPTGQQSIFRHLKRYGTRVWQHCKHPESFAASLTLDIKVGKVMELIIDFFFFLEF